MTTKATAAELRLTVKATEPPVKGSLIHLSDLHLDPDVLPGSASAKFSIHDGGRLNTDLLREFIDRAKKLRPSVLIVSGDLISGTSLATGPDGTRLDEAQQKAKRMRGLNYAKYFIRDLAMSMGIPKSAHSKRVVVVPGNHDVDLRAAGALSDAHAAFRQTMSGFLTPFSAEPFHLDEELGLCLLALDTTFLVGLPIPGGTPKTGPAFDQREILKVLAKIAKRRKAIESRRGQRFHPLSVAVSHYPAGIVPTGAIDVEYFEVALGAAQAKAALVRAGFNLLLHGHKHTSFLQEEEARMTGGEGAHASKCATLGAASFTQPPPGSSAGFNFIEYVTSVRCGGGNLLVAPYILRDFKPDPPSPPWKVAVPPVVTPAKVLKVLERIDQFGDSRTDISFFHVPVPGPDSPYDGGWSRKGNSWVRIFDRLIQVENVFTGKPLAASLRPGAKVTVERVSPLIRDGGRSWNIRVQTAVRNPVSFTERTWSLNAYALSTDHQDALFAPPLNLAEFKGYELLGQCVREPAERLELFIRFPYDLPASEGTVRLSASIERAVNDTSSPKDEFQEELLRFSRTSIDDMRFMKRLRVVVENPIVGVTYWVAWELPPSSRLKEHLRYFPRSKAEEETIASFRKRHATPKKRDAAVKIFKGYLNELKKKIGASKNVECALFLPTHVEGGPAILDPVVATYPPSSTLWKHRWTSSRGVVGRAFSTGKVVSYLSPKHENGTLPAANDWAGEGVSCYEKLPRRAHTLLFGIPIFGDSRAVLGVLCVGSFRKNEQAALEPLGGRRMGLLDPAFPQVQEFSTVVRNFLGNG